MIDVVVAGTGINDVIERIAVNFISTGTPDDILNFNIRRDGNPAIGLSLIHI